MHVKQIHEMLCYLTWRLNGTWPALHLEKRALRLVTQCIKNIKRKCREQSWQGRRCFPPLTGWWLMKALPTNHLREKSRKQPRQKIRFYHRRSHPFKAYILHPICSRTTLIFIQGALHTFPQPTVPLQPPTYPQLPIAQPFHSRPQTPMPCAGLQPSWNASMSPSIYELVITPPTVRKCYGCGNELSEKYKTPPSNIIIKHVDKRVTGKDSITGQLLYSQDYSNTYYHPLAAHITKKNPLFSGQVYLSYELYRSLDNAQHNYLNTLHSLDIIFK